MALERKLDTEMITLEEALKAKGHLMDLILFEGFCRGHAIAVTMRLPGDFPSSCFKYFNPGMQATGLTSLVGERKDIGVCSLSSHLGLVIEVLSIRCAADKLVARRAM